MIYIFDRNGKRLGHIKDGQIAICFDHRGKQIAKIAYTGSQAYLYDSHNRLVARFNGASTYNKHNNFIGKGNLLYKIIYHNLARVRHSA